MPARSEIVSPPPDCPKCGAATAILGKLPAFGLHPLIHVYKCDACQTIVQVEPGRRE